MELYSVPRVPARILTDQGANFVGKKAETTELYFLCSIKKINTTPYHPKTNGLVERFNYTLANMLSAYTSSNEEDWDEKLPAVIIAYRQGTHSTLTISPFEMLFGFKARILLDHFVEPSINEEILDTEMILDKQKNYKRNMHEKLYSVQEFIKTQLQEKIAKRKEKQEEKQKKEEKAQYAVGDLVFVKFLKKKKLDHPWRGPYVIIEVFQDSPVYEVVVANEKGEPKPNAKKQVVNEERLKPYYPYSFSSMRQDIRQVEDDAEEIGRTEEEEEEMQAKDVQENKEITEMNKRPIRTTRGKRNFDYPILTNDSNDYF